MRPATPASNERPRARRRVALLIETSKAYGRGLLRGISRFNRAHDEWEISTDERSFDTPPPPWLSGWSGDGIITRSSDLQLPEAALKTGAAIVHLGEPFDERFPGIATTIGAVSELAADHLLDRGFSSFGFVGIKGVSWSDSRQESFSRITTAKGGRCSVLELAAMSQEANSWETDQRAIVAWIQSLPKPVGIMACYDVVGLRLLETCRSLGLSVPEHIAVIGVDNDEVLCELADPPLTSVEQNIERIGYEAAATLQRLMDGKRAPRMRYVDPVRVVARQSSDVVAISDAEIAEALRFIREHAATGIDVSDVSSHVALSRRVLERRFRSQLGSTPHAEILKVQIRRASQLLQETNHKLELVATRAGFSSASYMCRVFKKAMGMSPREHRRASSENALPK